MDVPADAPVGLAAAAFVALEIAVFTVDVLRDLLAVVRLDLRLVGDVDLAVPFHLVAHVHFLAEHLFAFTLKQG